ncbi:MAG: hypothetical protein Q4P28_05770 [Tissierellia bacterium]|nr:hypothetical protein [Tissierellia bacterium]
MRTKVFLPFLIFMTLALIVSCEKEDSNSKTTEKSDPPMVMVNGTLYKETGFVNGNVTCGTPDGKIASTITNGVPEKNDQSNFGTDYEYQYSRDGLLNVRIKDQWIIFRDVDIDNDEIPVDVPHFKGKVVYGLQDEIHVKILELPEEFSWIFQNRSLDEIKDIRTTIEKLYPPKEIQGAEELEDQEVILWFDGRVEKQDLAISSLMELPKVYRIEMLTKEKP